MNNKVYYILIGLLIVAVTTLSGSILSLRKVPDAEIFKAHLDNFDRAAERLKRDCHAHYKMAMEADGKSTNPVVVQGLAALSNMKAFGDSADVHFNRLESFKDNPDSARLCLAQYVRFSTRFAAAAQAITNMEVYDPQTYLLKIEDRLPGKKIPLGSPEGVQLLTLILRIDFYERLQVAMNKLVSFG